MKKELPTGVVAAIIIAVILVIAVVGYSRLGSKSSQLTDTEQKQATQTMQDQYKQFGPSQQRPPGGGPPMMGR